MNHTAIVLMHVFDYEYDHFHGDKTFSAFHRAVETSEVRINFRRSAFFVDLFLCDLLIVP